MITAALALLTQVPADAAYATRLLPVFVLFGIGGGLTLPAGRSARRARCPEAPALPVVRHVDLVGAAYAAEVATSVA